MWQSYIVQVTAEHLFCIKHNLNVSALNNKFINKRRRPTTFAESKNITLRKQNIACRKANITSATQIYHYNVAKLHCTSGG